LEKTNKLKSLILDMDGVLWRDKTPIGDLKYIFKKIDSLGLGYILATNNAAHSPEQYVEKLAGFGVQIDSERIVTSAMAAGFYLRNQFTKGGDIYVIGEQGLKITLRKYGFTTNGENPVAVVAALDREINYQKLTQATLLIRSGIPFIGTNPDRSFPIPEGEAPGAGAILAALEAATSVSPVIIGKPGPIMYQFALERLETSAEATLVIGDRLETDIKGAQNAGCRSALVLTGVTSIDTAKRFQPPPDLIATDLTTLLVKIEGGIDKEN
jgi:4-nitrophenyl phosphatase